MKTKTLLLFLVICCSSLMAQQISRGSLNVGSTVPNTGHGDIAVTQNNVRLLIVEKAAAPVPANGEHIILDNIYPNPASDNIVIKISTVEAGKVQFRFFNAAGAFVSATAWKQIEKGGHAVTLNVRDLPAEIYMVSAYFEDSFGNIRISSTAKLTKF